MGIAVQKKLKGGDVRRGQTLRIDRVARFLRRRRQAETLILLLSGPADLLLIALGSYGLLWIRVRISRVVFVCGWRRMEGMQMRGAVLACR
jgi:hypothetical protein